jgi:hypothetical protein
MPATKEDSWTDAEKDQLKRYWKEGFTAAAIGERIGKTPAAVTGMRKRMDLPPRRSPIGQASGKPQKPQYSTRQHVPMVGATTLPPLASLVDD